MPTSSSPNSEPPANWPPGWPWHPAAGRGSGGDGAGDDPSAPGPRFGAVVEAPTAVVATTDGLATAVGLDVLRAGGNAVDAAVAAAFALAVVNPEAGNLGGGGFTLVRTSDGSLHALDHRSAAPAGATRDMFLDEHGRRTERAEAGALAVAVPGTVRGLGEAHRRFGTRPWASLVDPAVELARGFRVTERFVRSFPPHIVEGLRRFPESAAVFLPEGRPPRVGERFVQADLAGTLEGIRDRGAEGFYRGPTARAVAAEMARGGGVLTEADLAAYRAVWRTPVRVPYRGHTLVSTPPPSSGGLTLAATARILEGFDLGAMEWHAARHVHLLAEAWRRAFADRNHYLADPDFVSLPAETLASEAYGRFRAAAIRWDRAGSSADVGPGVEAFRGAGGVRATGRGPEGAHTTHVSVVDAAGNAVSLTTTLNTWYGSKLVAAGTGVLLNNEMDDFTARPGEPNHFGLVQGEANAIEPGKRPLSAMAPSLVLGPDGGLRMVVGTPGGATILTQVFQVVSNVLDHGMEPATAVRAPRVHHQHLPDRIEVEPGGLPEGVVAELAALGHRIEEREEPWGDVQAVSVRPGGGLQGVADPRRGGAAGGL